MLLDWLIPPLCVACRNEHATRHGDPLCTSCRAEIPWLGARTCPRCAQPRPCGRCPARRRAFDTAFAAVAYAGPVPALVNGLKERGALRLADTMAAQIVAAAPAALWPTQEDDEAALVPVPADPWRQRKRGIDHARQIAAALSTRTGLTTKTILARAAPRSRQVSRARSERLRADPADVQIRTPTRAPPRTAILVDDVHTTGATLHACSLALKGFGVARVVAVTYARTLA